jgi:hypothetical protein
MKFQLKPRLFLIGFLPGFLFIVGFIILYKKFDFLSIKLLAQNITLFTGTAIVIISFMIGQVFDSFRDWFVELIFEVIVRKNKGQNINWDFFYKSSSQEINKLDDNYFIYYVVNLNISISLFALMIFIFFNWPNKIPSSFFISKSFIVISVVICIIILVGDSWILRKHIAKATNLEKSN